MKATEHTALIHQIAQNLNDPTMVTGLLATLSSDYTDSLARIEKMTPFEVDNENLRSANMKLFSQIGSQDKALEVEGKKIETKGKETDPKTSLSYENLFNAKGGLK